MSPLVGPLLAGPPLGLPVTALMLPAAPAAAVVGPTAGATAVGARRRRVTG